MGFTFCITVMSDSEIFDQVPVSTFVGQREWSVTSLVYCICTCTSVLNDAAIESLTSRIPMTLVHKILDCVQVAIGTGQRECSVTSWLYMYGWYTE